MINDGGLALHAAENLLRKHTKESSAVNIIPPLFTAHYTNVESF